MTEREQAKTIQEQAQKCCDGLPCRTLTTLIAVALVAAREEGRKEAVQSAFDIAASWATHFETNAQLPGQFAALNLEKLVAAQCIRDEIGQLREQK